MNAHERQHFDVVLHLAVESFAERLVQRNDGPAGAAARLDADPDGDGVWLSRFVDAVFDDHALSTTAGAVFVLEALERRPWVDATREARTIGEALQAAARAAFAALLRQKTLEELSRRSSFQAVSPEGAR